MIVDHPTVLSVSICFCIISVCRNVSLNSWVNKASSAENTECECLQVLFMSYKMELLDMLLCIPAAAKWLLASSSAWTHSQGKESSRGERGGKHTEVYSTYQYSGNPTGSGIRRLATHTVECEHRRNIAEISVLTLNWLCTGIQIRDLTLLGGIVSAGDNSSLFTLRFFSVSLKVG